MNVVALISGGKDSCFAALQARRTGHTIVALAHVKARCDEADSMMYQSVGSSAVTHLASAFGCPLIMHETNAAAKCTSLHYAPVPGDEVEDLVALLTKVKAQFPHVQAVCSGALWSDYQRIRVENAAYRTGLISLAPLWRCNQPALLDRMIDAGIDAVLIKVAGIGLNESHLGKTLAEMRPTLLKLEALYGSHVCGEGGEYETFVRWMPGFRASLHFDRVKVVSHSHDPVAPVSYLCLEQVSLVPLTDALEKINSEERDWREKHVLDYEDLFTFSPKSYDSKSDCDTSFLCANSFYSFSNCHSSNGNFASIVVRSEREGADGVKHVCESLAEHIEQLSESIHNIIFVQLFLPDASGSFYAEANRVYNNFFFSFGGKTVPGRACVGTGSRMKGAALEALLRRGERTDVRIVHVQSVSSWAPPCIGPYCQFVEEDGIVHVSGVLPLHPATVLVPKGMPARRQVEVCVDNMRRTLDAGRAKVDSLKMFVVYCSVQQAADEVSAAMQEFLPADSISVHIPVQTLPKNAIVEMRAVGLVESQTSECLQFTESFENVSCRSTVCGDLAFAIFEGFVPLGNDFLNCNKRIGDWNPLSAQLFYKRKQGNDDTNVRCEVELVMSKMTSCLATVAVSAFSCDWFPCTKTHWILVGTYSRAACNEADRS